MSAENDSDANEVTAEAAGTDELGLSSATLLALQEFALSSGVACMIAENDSDANEVTAEAAWTDELGLSAATLLALQEFALSSGVAVDSYGSIIESVRKHFEPECRDDVFDINYTSKDGTRDVAFKLKGVKRELGQTLYSTGLTIWRAAEHLCQFMVDHPEYFIGKTVCELGAGLGLVAVLLDKLGYCYSKDKGSSNTKPSAASVASSMLYRCSFDTAYLYWEEHVDYVLSNPHKFDLAIAADVIYEETQIVPLIETVASVIKEGTGEFMLAFARRNVKIDFVHEAATAQGLQWQTIDEH